ncbi:hypothetical protein [Crocosphaera sp.]|uniref:hypothetical protein n=1 Tax=Crocosphaera sp. TaxID=2729996 RepID=UPI00261069A6|nr:hypothetical protein [Crocosphaera sp.]MDJ0579036.1 hypothetical protein [Crocosphaera sp.]
MDLSRFDIFNLFSRKKEKLTGSQRSVALGDFGSSRRQWDLEIEENPIREPHLAQELIKIENFSREVYDCLEIAAQDTFASTDGDDIGFTVAETIDDNETAVHTDIYVIAMEVIQRKQNHEKMVIGGTLLQKALKWSLIYGDAFLELAIEREGITKNDYCVSKSLYLPTWEIFRCEDDHGNLEGFEQRRYLHSTSPDNIFTPPQIVHFRHNQKYLYGKSLWLPSLGYWAKLKEATENLAVAAREAGINPTLHIFPEGYAPNQRTQYKNNYEQRKLSGELLTDIYLLSGMELKKLSSSNPSLTGLIDTVLQWRYHMIPSGFPIWLFPGLQPSGGAKEISRAPDRNYARKRYGWCQLLTKGIRQVIDTEIILKMGWDFYYKEVLKGGGYRIIWPEWQIDGMADTDESNQQGINDLDLEGNEDGGQIQTQRYRTPVF